MAKFIQIITVEGEKILLNTNFISSITVDNSLLKLVIEHTDGSRNEIQVSDDFGSLSSALGAITTDDH